MILIVGANGHLGSAAAKRLLAGGNSVRVMARNPVTVSYLQELGAEVVTGDLRDPASLRSACQGVKQVVAAAHALNGKGDNNPHTVDDLGNRHLIEAAKAAGVEHFIFVSIQGAGPEADLELFRIKYSIEETLRTSGLNFTILKPTAYMDLWDQLVGQPILEHGRATIFGKGDNPINFVAAEDVAGFICKALEDPCALNRVIEVGGPENLTMNQVVNIFERIGGRKAIKRSIPLSFMRAMSLLLKRVNPTLSRIIQTGIYMDTADLRFDMSSTLLEFPLPLTSFEDWARSRYPNLSAPTA